MTDESNDGKSPYFYGIATIIVCISMFELFALFQWGSGAWLDKLSVLLALIGLYGIALGVFTKSERLADLKEILIGLTDPNPLIYVSSNLYFSATLCLFGALGLRNRMEPNAPMFLSIFGLFVWLPFGVILLLYALFHIVVVAFLAYVPLVIASAIIMRIEYAAGDFKIIFGTVEMSLKSAVRGNSVALKGYVMGIPALALSVISAVVKII